MMRCFVVTSFAVLFSMNALGQTPEARPRFEIADVHPSAKSQNHFARPSSVRDRRYEIRNASIVDLVRLAYGFDADKIFGGPSWVEIDRFDVTGLTPKDSTPETHKLMLQSLLEERFRLKLRDEMRPLPTYVLVAGKKPQLKEADGSGSTGCKPQTTTGPAEPGAPRLMMGNINGGPPVAIQLGPGMTVTYNCKNMTMAAFAAGLRGMIGTTIVNAVTDETDIKGQWNFDVKWSIQLNGGPLGFAGDRISIFTAVEKQLGLKLDPRSIPTPVVVIESVDRQPTPNSPEVAKNLPPIPVPTEFEVVDLKQSSPEARGSSIQIQPGGRLIAKSVSLRLLISRALSTGGGMGNNSEEITGIPKWADDERFDVNAKTAMSGGLLDMDVLAPMFRAMLVDRFKMKYHTEEKPISAYALVGSKPKMKKADPASRTFCKNENPPPGSPPATRMMVCQNMTMALFAERLQNADQRLNWPVEDATGLDGGWDFTLTYAMFFQTAIASARPVDAGSQPLPVAEDPNGAVSLFDALDKQLGLKLESRKRTARIFVVDQIEQKPTEN